MPVPQIVYLVFLQVAAKAVTFLLNQVLLRRISPEIFGIAAYLEFLVNTVLFFSREAVRIACQRASAESTIAKFAYLPLLLFVPVCSGLFYLQTYSSLYQNTLAQLPYFGLIFTLIPALIALELLAEPWFAVNQHRLDFKTRSKAEGSAIFLKCVSIFLLVSWWQKTSAPELFKGQAVLAFAIGHFVYSAVIFGVYWAGLKSGHSDLSKDSKTLKNDAGFDKSLLSVWKLLFIQMIFKHLLTEGDTLLISYLFSVGQQGVYSVIANYGSMVARLLFQPVEELVRVSFTRNLSQKSPDYAGAHQQMTQLIVFYVNFSLLIVIGGYTNGSFLLRLLLGRSEKWLQSTVFSDFPFYVLYIPFMAFNGILEAFFSSASSQAQIGQFSVFMSFLSVSVFALMYIFIGKLGLGIRGLILANMANMSFRIIYCLVFYVNYFSIHLKTQRRPVWRRFVVPVTLAAGAMALQHVLFENGATSNYVEFAKSILVCFTCLVVMVVNERRQILTAVAGLRKSKRE